MVAALFAAERIAKPGNAMYKAPIPGSHAKTNPLDFAPKMFAYAMLCLRDEGAITLQIASKKVLFVTTAWIEVHRAASPGASVGLSARLLQAVVDGKSAKDVVAAWFPSDVYNPWGLAVQAATQEAIDAGYLAPVEQKSVVGKIGSKLTGNLATTVLAGKETELRRIADDTAKRWAAYQAQDGTLLERLVKECGGGISARRSQAAAEAAEGFGPD